MDSMIVQNIDNVFEEDESKDLIFTYDHAMDSGHSRAPPVQGGFLMIKPNLDVYERIIDVVREGDFRPGTGWAGSRIGWCWGGQTVQGLLAYYYTMVESNKGLALDPCRYNSMATTDNCSAVPWPEVKSAHFTQCQKPWECHKGKGICVHMHMFWWKLRQNLEKGHGLPATPQCCHACSVHHYTKLPLETFESPVWPPKDRVKPYHSMNPEEW
mmetsp:Transcript_10800/g.12387  ORF Transcript_10800/g.12387 Transcript_10800/m.12387 type:complete len:213 (-) Transcript_10800:330-968(-)